jgi:ATP-dependent helicase/nuclease subunit B
MLDPITTLEPKSNSQLELLTGPAGSGKTRAAVARALECAKRGERVIVLTLPNQRTQFLERLAANGPSLGVEVTNLQNIAYRLLDRLGQNRPVVLNPGRVALTARILERILERSIGPGEARLYARAVAECKRFGFVPMSTGEPYQDTLTQVYSGYEAALVTSDLQDLDDVRLRLTHLLETQPLELGAHLIVDGYRSFNPSELEVIRALSNVARSSLVTLPAGSPDTHLEAWAHPLRPAEIRAITSRLNARIKGLDGTGKPWAGLPKTVRLETYSNPVEESRATLRKIKCLMHEGARAQDIAIVIPNPVFVRVLEALGREYAVPIAPETQGGALETPDGRKLEALLAAPARDYPVRELRALSGLEPDLAILADALEQAGVAAGSSAYSLVCFDRDALDALERVRLIAQPPETGTAVELVAWFEALLERFVRDAPFAESARVIAREAARILEPTSETSMPNMTMTGAGFTDWLRNLLSSLQVTHPDAGRGVAVVTAEEISGRRFDHVFVIGATDGAYRSGDGEDFFVPEEQRDQLEQLLRLIPGLPKKLNGLEDSSFFDIATRANLSLNISHPRAERGASLRPHPRLTQLAANGANSSDVPATASTLELAAAQYSQIVPPRAMWKIKPRATTRATDLERAAQCNLRSWADAALPAPARASGLVTDELLRSWGSKMRRAKWKGEDTNALEAIPEEHKDRLASLASGFRHRLEQVIESRVPGQPGVDVQLGYRANLDGIEFTLDGVRFKRDPSGQIRSTEIFRVLEDANDGYSQFMNPERQREWWFAHAMHERGSMVTFWAWDLNNQPKFVMNLEKPYAQRRLAESLLALEETKKALETGSITANPGFHCRLCSQRDVCREVV